MQDLAAQEGFVGIAEVGLLVFGTLVEGEGGGCCLIGPSGLDGYDGEVGTVTGTVDGQRGRAAWVLDVGGRLSHVVAVPAVLGGLEVHAVACSVGVVGILVAILAVTYADGDGAVHLDGCLRTCPAVGIVVEDTLQDDVGRRVVGLHAGQCAVLGNGDAELQVHAFHALIGLQQCAHQAYVDILPAGGLSLLGGGIDCLHISVVTAVADHDVEGGVAAVIVIGDDVALSRVGGRAGDGRRRGSAVGLQ